MENIHFLFVGLLGILAGFINVLAASGSIVVLPMLIFLGIEPNVANGTNRVAILVQNIIAVRNFRKQKLLSIRTNLPIIIAAFIGAGVGTLTVVQINKEDLNVIIGALLLIMFFLMILKPSLWIKSSGEEHLHKIQHKSQWVLFFLIGFYGGFIQAGVGIFLIAALVLGIKYQLLRAHAVKLLVMLAYTPLSLAIFILYDLIDWKIAIILSTGHAVGAYVASRYARYFNVKKLTILLMTIVLLSSLKLIGFFKFVSGFFK